MGGDSLRVAAMSASASASASPPASASASATSLCTSCGLCCNGAIFSKAPLQPEETAQARSLGLDLFFQDGGAWFSLPCPRLRERSCSIYESRLGICRSYRCRVLDACESGELGEAEAHAIVERAKSLVEALRPHLLEGQTLSAARAEWVARRATGRSLEEDADRVARAPFDLAMTALNLFLDRHFRIEKQKNVVASPVGPPPRGEPDETKPAVPES